VITITVHNGKGRTEYYLTDHLGSIRTTIDDQGKVLGYDDYDPFGNVLPGRSYNAGTPNDLNKFTSHERDQEGGLDYMLARNYDSELGRFYSVDPLYYKYHSTSPYAYVLNNPLR
jgi:RHS repeat-associated protein